MKQNGNALFLILIAVALFAALSYAVTQSGRGGGSVDREQLELDLAQLMNQASTIKTFLQKSKLLATYDQVHANYNAENTSGTVYEPDGGTSTGLTVGLFNTAATGVPVLHPPDGLWFGPPIGTLNTFTWGILYNQRVQVGGIEKGSTLGDMMIVVFGLSYDACLALNSRLGHGSVIASLSVSGAANRSGGSIVRDGSTIHYNVWDEVINYSLEPPVCTVGSPDEYIFVDSVEAN